MTQNGRIIEDIGKETVQRKRAKKERFNGTGRKEKETVYSG